MMAKITEEAALVHEGGDDYVLRKRHTVWIRAGGRVVWIRQRGKHGVLVDVYENGKECADPIAMLGVPDK